jgi:hypothetical protein
LFEIKYIPSGFIITIIWCPNQGRHQRIDEALIIMNMNYNLTLQHVGKTDKREEKDMYQLSFKTYNTKIEGKFERSEIRHMIQILDNAII